MSKHIKTWTERMPKPRVEYQCAMNCSPSNPGRACGDCTPVKVYGDAIAARDAEIAELRAELAGRFRAQGGNTNDKGSDLAPTTSTVSATEEVRNQVRDAARYRWLRVNNIVTNVRFHFASGESPYLYAEALDEAIDHNMGYDPLEALRTTSGKGEAA